jgi:hypothetical protein
MPARGGRFRAAAFPKHADQVRNLHTLQGDVLVGVSQGASGLRYITAVVRLVLHSLR